MTKNDFLKQYEELLTVKGMEEIGKMMIVALSVAYDTGFQEGVKLFSEVTSKLNLPLDK